MSGTLKLILISIFQRAEKHFFSLFHCSTFQHLDSVQDNTQELTNFI